MLQRTNEEREANRDEKERPIIARDSKGEKREEEMVKDDALGMGDGKINARQGRGRGVIAAGGRRKRWHNNLRSRS